MFAVGSTNATLLFFLKSILFIFRDRVRQGEREGEKHQCVFASHAPPTEDQAATQACTLTENPTGGLLIYRLALNPLSHSSQGPFIILYKGF